jgi:2-polyprenyl-3-methyl-5-hydroxy-6-metoxy-1,4-benzoquinol methylase
VNYECASAAIDLHLSSRRSKIMVDFGKTAVDYRKHRAGFPEAFIEALQRYGVGLPGQQIVDLGTGTGTLARNFAKTGAHVIGIDISELLLTQARAIAQEDQVAVEFQCAAAEETGLPAQTFDAVTAGQCWHWFDRPRVAAEARRLLKPGSMLVIAHFDWIPLPGNVVDLTERLIMRHNPAWTFGGGTGVHPAWFADMAIAGFDDLRSFSFDVLVTYSHEDWRGRIRASAGIAASLDMEQVEWFDTEHAAALRNTFPDDPLVIPHRIWAVLGRSPTGRDTQDEAVQPS